MQHPEDDLWKNVTRIKVRRRSEQYHPLQQLREENRYAKSGMHPLTWVIYRYGFILLFQILSSFGIFISQFMFCEPRLGNCGRLLPGDSSPAMILFGCLVCGWAISVGLCDRAHLILRHRDPHRPDTETLFINPPRGILLAVEAGVMGVIYAAFVS